MPFKIEEANPLDGCGKEVGWKSMEDFGVGVCCYRSKWAAWGNEADFVGICLTAMPMLLHTRCS